MQLLLAPMEGLLDFALRDTLTRVTAPTSSGPHHDPRGQPHPSGIDRCVAEFIRITDTVLPPRAFIRTIPELLNGGYTASGVPVRGQLLGSDPGLMAANAARLAQLGSQGVDLNFGCPAQVVNRHGGGASLLKEPERLHTIAHAVRQAVPSHVPVSAKMRLGFDDDQRAEDCAHALAEAGVTEIVVHARTKAQGYRPPAYWERIADLHAVVPPGVTLVANGEIWSVSDAHRARTASACTHLMLGRGMVADPGLAWAIRTALQEGSLYPEPTTQACPPTSPMADEVLPHGQRVFSACTPLTLFTQTLPPPSLPWPEVRALLPHFWQQVGTRVERRHRAGRLKQWLNLLRRRYPEAQAAFDLLRTTNDADAVGAWLAHPPPPPPPPLHPIHPSVNP